MRKAAIWSLGVGAVLLVAGGVGLKRMLDYGFSTKDDPTVLEQVVTRRMRYLSMPSSHTSPRNPVPFSREVLKRAEAHFADHCASCHGNDGHGHTPIGQNLYPRAPDMSMRETQDLPDGHLFLVIKNGVRLTGMPGWGQDTPEDDRQTWELVHFIRHLPDITPQELAEMEGLNPKSRAEWEQETAAKSFLAGSDPQDSQP